MQLIELQESKHTCSAALDSFYFCLIVGNLTTEKKIDSFKSSIQLFAIIDAIVYL